MTKEEILAKVQATIAGQGNEVDLGGALPAILSAIVELIPEGGGSETGMAEGIIEEGEFIPNSGSTFEEAVQIMKNGGIFYFHITERNADITDKYVIATLLNVNDSGSTISGNDGETFQWMPN